MAHRSEVIQWLFWQASGLGPMLGTWPDPRNELLQLYFIVRHILHWVVWAGLLTPGQCMYFKRIAAPVVADVTRVQFGIDRFEKEALRLLGIINDRLEVI